MKLSAVAVLFTAVIVLVATASVRASDYNRVKTANGYLEGTTDPATGIHEFKGIPFAQPPIGDLRWKAPQPVVNWKGVRPATQFGPRDYQHPAGDMVFRSNGVSEDCLYLNIWSPSPSHKAKLPVLVYFYGGGYVCGDGSEYRYDGESMAKKGIVAVTVNYRLGVFGFFADPDLTAESPYHSSGNYGLLDQNAALRWVLRNIKEFGGDPGRVTIAGESAGSFSVSAQMASPLSQGLFVRAIAESGSLLGWKQSSLADAEQQGATFAATLGASTLADLRAIPADQLLEAASKHGAPQWGPVIDGYFFPKLPRAIFADNDQAHVPLLVGWNSEESRPGDVMGNDDQTVENFTADVTKLYGAQATQVLSVYPVATDSDVEHAATALASDRFIAYGTWKLFDSQIATGQSPVYRYYFSRPRPGASGAVHSAEIEYALGNLSTNKVYAWTPDDYNISAVMQQYFADFIKTGNPNGPNLPNWPAANAGGTVEVMHLDVNSQAEPDTTAARYKVLDELFEAGEWH
jgi:para-nitrobenzyl esterase